MRHLSRTIRSVIAAGVIGLAAPLVLATSAMASPTASATPANATTAVTAKAAAVAASGKHITIPSNYVYNPNTTHQRTLHDYCTASPDEFPNPVGANANFRGPCARHDMCIQYKQHARSTCDSYLLSNMRSECAYTYPHWYQAPVLSACYKTAAIYWAVVRVKTVFS